MFGFGRFPFRNMAFTRLMTDKPGFDLHLSDQRFQLLVNAVTDYAIYMLDPAGHVVSWNPGARRFKGYEADEIIGQHFSRFFEEKDRAAGLPGHALRTAAAEGRFEAEGWRVRKDGSRFWVSAVIDPIRDDAGVLIGFEDHARHYRKARSRAEAVFQRTTFPHARARCDRLRHLHARPAGPRDQLEQRRGNDQGL
ncbi:PAS domain-containing protein [Sphingomonas sp. So64.6b]|uniref:PAS domain-containing protein n=1 Tax=Sphingomonas sp. So64.6b TaxID=2997354 RepID=UPI001FCEFE45|nr:PAS domain-containing protein [Sphingomonas sp. So64.6b]